MAKNTRRKSGKRDKSGRLAKATTRAERNVAPNDRVRERMERFSHKAILDGKAAHDTYDGPGQLHAMGYFHNHGHEPSVIRDAFREYSELYWYWFACLDSGSADYEPNFGGGGIASRSSPLPPAAKAERRFQALESFLPSGLSSPERRALHMVAVSHWGSDTVHPFIERLVDDKMAALGLPVNGKMLAVSSDHADLAAALRAAFAMIEGGMKPDYINPLRIAA